MNVTTIVTNILNTHNNNTIPTTQAVYEYAAAAVDLNNDVTYTLGMTNTSASLVTLRNRSTSTAIHPETEAGAVLLNDGTNLSTKLNSIDSRLNQTSTANQYTGSLTVRSSTGTPDVTGNTFQIIVGSSGSNASSKDIFRVNNVANAGYATCSGTLYSSSISYTPATLQSNFAAKINTADVATHADIDNLPLFN